ncbi:MAG: ThuA domain-containing protein [Verrucomicrobia bacterium]|nr:ThuA domain-containing protein [Verrucomicrobiota bacterium]MDA1006452.1 ThuA domain-containing protein [Verrucomicrobiota bacterium]
MKYATLLLFFFSTVLHGQDKIRVLVWDEQQPVGKKVYESFPGNFIADHLRKNPKLEVTTAKQDDPEFGLTSEVLKRTDVLLYWAHVRQRDIPEGKGQEIADLVKAGKLAFVPLHSAHWSVPFMVCMQEKAAQDALAALAEDKRANAKVVYEGKIQWQKAGEFDRNVAPPRYEFDEQGKVTVRVTRPNCVFPRCCGPGQPSEVRVVHQRHPICQGVPSRFTLEVTEMYDEPFGVPEPDTVLFTEGWKGGEFFRSGCLWNLGQGKIFYVRPGDQAYPIYANPHLLTLLENACVWMGQ